MTYAGSKGLKRSLGSGNAVWIVTFLCLIAFVFYQPSFEGGADQSAYSGTARRLALTGMAIKHTAHPLEYVSENFVQTGDRTFYAKYPPGYSWLCTLAFKLGGQSAVFLVNPLLAASALLGVFFLGRSLISDLAGGLAAVVLATNSVHTEYSLAVLSHTGAECFAVWGMWFLWRWTRLGGWGYAALAGVLTGFAGTVRHSEMLLVLPALAMVIVVYWSRSSSSSDGQQSSARPSWFQTAVLMGAASFALVPLALHQWQSFGAPWRTGYGLSAEAMAFSWRYFQANWWVMLKSLNNQGLFLTFSVGIAGLVYLAFRRPKLGLFLGLWAIPPILLHTAYYWAPDQEGSGCTRFFLSAFPPLILAALALLSEAVGYPQVSESPPTTPATPFRQALRALALGGIVTVVATCQLRAAIPVLQSQMDRLLAVKQTWDVVRPLVPDGAIIVAESRVLNTLEYIGDYELYSEETFSRRDIRLQLKVLEDNEPHPLQREKARALSRMVGNLSDSQLADLQRSLLSSNVAAGRTVVFVGTADQFHTTRGRLGDAFDYQRVTEWVNDVDLGGASVATRWVLCRLRPPRERSLDADSLEALELKIDQAQFKLRSLRGEFEDRYPGFQQKLDEISAIEQQLSNYRGQAGRLTIEQRFRAAMTTAVSPPRSVTNPVTRANDPQAGVPKK